MVQINYGSTRLTTSIRLHLGMQMAASWKRRFSATSLLNCGATLSPSLGSRVMSCASIMKSVHMHGQASKDYGRIVRHSSCKCNVCRAALDCYLRWSQKNKYLQWIISGRDDR